MTRINKRALLAGFLGLSLLGGTASANFRLEVVDGTTGQALKHAAVCLGYLAGSSEVHRQVLDSSGALVLPHLPRTPLQLTVAAYGKATVHRALPRLDYPMTLRVAMHPGVSGSNCQAPAPIEVPASVKNTPEPSVALRIRPPRLLNVQLLPLEGQRFRLSSTAKGMPTHVRLANTPAFRGAKWVSYSPEMDVELPGRSGQSVYIQLKRASSLPDQVAEVSVSSAVVTTTIN